MVNPRRFGMADFLLLFVVLVVAAGSRVWYLSLCCDQARTEGPYPVQDRWSEERDSLVRNLKEGQFIGPAPLSAGEEKTAHTGYLYPSILALLDRPANSLELTYQRMRWLQAGLGTLAAGFLFLFSRRAFRSLLAAFLSGLIAGVYPFWVFNTAEINDGVVVCFLLSFCLFLGVRAGQSGGALTSLLYGLAFAALASTRAALLPLAFVAVLWFLWRCRQLPRGWLYAILAFLGFINGLIPWVTRNFQSFHDVTPVVTSAYLHFWEGNNPRATGGPMTEEEMRHALDEEQPGRAEQIVNQPNQAERYRALGRDAVTEVMADPSATVQRRLQAGAAFLFGQQWLTSRKLMRGDPQAAGDVPAWLANRVDLYLAGSLLFVFLLGLLGWRWTYAWRYEAMPSSLVPVWVLLPYLLSHAEAFSGPRLPLDGVLICYAAFVLACVVPPARSRLLRLSRVERYEREVQLK